MTVPELWTGSRAESVNDYAGVLVELEEAHLHSHSCRSGRRTEFDESLEDDDADGDSNHHGGRGGGKSGGDDDECTGMLEMSVAVYSIEGLRKEVRRGGAKGETWTAYESEFLSLYPFFFSFFLLFFSTKRERFTESSDDDD